MNSNINDLGPLETLLEDPTIHTIMVNGHNRVYVSRQAFLIEETDVQFRDNDHLLQIIDRILEPLGLIANESHPIVNARLSDRSQVHVIVPPIALDGPVMTIRKAVEESQLPTFETLIEANSVSPEIVEFLRACIQSRITTLVCGGTGSGKTTLLNLIANFIPEHRRIILIEKEADLILRQPHIVRLEARPANREGKGEITLAQLVEAAAHMNPDCVVCSEVYGDELEPLLQTINGGLKSALFALHANGPRDALAHMEMLIASANPALPLLNIRQQIAHALNLIVEVEILPDGWRRVMKVSEVTGMTGDYIQTTDIFEFIQTGMRPDGKIEGVYAATGYIPSFISRLKDYGNDLPLEMFAASGKTWHHAHMPHPPVPPMPPHPPAPPMPPFMPPTPPIPPRRGS